MQIFFIFQENKLVLYLYDQNYLYRSSAKYGLYKFFCMGMLRNPNLFASAMCTNCESNRFLCVQQDLSLIFSIELANWSSLWFYKLPF